MHNGSKQTLDDVVTFYYRGIPKFVSHGLSPDIEPLQGRSYSEVHLLVEFLKSLSGKPPEITRPILP